MVIASKPPCGSCGDPASRQLEGRWLCQECHTELTVGILPSLHDKRRGGGTGAVRKVRARRTPNNAIEVELRNALLEGLVEGNRNE